MTRWTLAVVSALVLCGCADDDGAGAGTDAGPATYEPTARPDFRYPDYFCDTHEACKNPDASPEELSELTQACWQTYAVSWYRVPADQCWEKNSEYPCAWADCVLALID